MEVSKRQVWVTSALTEMDVRNALVLCHSLKQAFTSRPVAVITSPSLFEHLRNLLEVRFDLVLYMPKQDAEINLIEEDFAKVFAISSLKLYSKAVYISPSFVALQNPDEIFEEYKESVLSEGLFLLPENGTSIMLFKPSLEVGRALLNGLNSLEKIKDSSFDFGSYLNTWTKNQFGLQEQPFPVLKEKYNRFLRPGSILLGNETDFVFVNLACIDPLKISNENLDQQFDDIGKRVLSYWTNIFRESIEPFLNLKDKLPSTSLKTYPQEYETEPIAIVGMSCRYPGCNNLEEFWNLLFSGEDGTATPPPFRWLREQSCFYKDEYRRTKAGFLKDPVDSFDSKFFGISPKEADFMDPQYRLLHELVWEALEDACINPQGLKGTPASVFMGPWLNDYRDIVMQSGDIEFFRTYLCNSIGAGAARISHFLNITGPNIATESGCSSAIVAVHLACRSLRMGETNLALACGVNLILHPFDKDAMPMVLAADGNCKTFCEKADGFVRSEGCGVLVLKRLSDAVKDKDNIWALIRGSAMAQEGMSKSIGTPTVECEALAMANALQDANAKPEEVSYVETHGTGTPVGDPLEVAAIAKTYHTSKRTKPLFIGSVKTNVGHTESCSGITGIMKVVLAMKNGWIPAHRNFSKINPKIDLDSIPAKIPLEITKWEAENGKPRLAGVSSFGITGTDAHVIVEEMMEAIPKPLEENKLDRNLHILKISAKTELALDTLLARYREASIFKSDHKFPDICYSANVGRANFSHRAFALAKSKEEFVQIIQQNKIGKAVTSVGEPNKICFLFTGQGCQYHGMAKDLYEMSPSFKMHFDYCDKILNENYSINVKNIMWEACSTWSQLHRTIYSQTSIFSVEYALFRLWESWGVKPDFVLGHSLGEFAAAVCAQILTLNDAIKLVAERSLLIESLPRGKMLVVRGSFEQVNSALLEFSNGDNSKMLDFAAINSNDQTVIAGDSEIVEDFSAFCKNKFMKCSILEATHAFHSKHMDPILKRYENIAKSVNIATAPSCGYISGLRGNVVNIKDFNGDYWVDHTREKVSFLDASKAAIELGCNIFIEIGPQPVLSALTMTNSSKNLICLPSLKRNEENWNTILNSLGKLYINGIDINWQSLDQFYGRKKIPNLPSYPFIGKKYWRTLGAGRATELVHPLVGKCIVNPSSIKLYQSGIDLASKHEFLGGHVFAGHVVFPGAGFLEMCLAAGYATVEGITEELLSTPKRALKIENFQIGAPLALYKGNISQLQTIVEYKKNSEDSAVDSDIKLSVKVFHLMDSIAGSAEETKFILHAEAAFYPFLVEEENFDEATNEFYNLDKFKHFLEHPGSEQLALKVYEDFNALGLPFGPTFQTIEKIWKTDQDDCNELLVKLKVTDYNEKGYLIHPLVLDAMFQTTLVFKMYDPKAKIRPKKVYVPIKVGKLVWFGKNLTDSFYLYVYNKTQADPLVSSSCDILLLDGVGQVLAKMSGMEFMETTAKSIEAILDHQTTKMPQLWQEVWRPQPGLMQHRADLELLNSLCASEDQNNVEQLNAISADLKQTLTEQDAFVFLNICRGLYETGWDLAAEFEFNSSEVQSRLGIKNEFAKLFRYYLSVLKDEGYLEQAEGKYKVIKSIPHLTEILQELNSSHCAQLVSKFQGARLISKIGTNLGKILVGDIQPVTLLFPENSPNGVMDSSLNLHGTMAELLKLFNANEVITFALSAGLQAWKYNENGGKQIMRILEVGKGTRNFTKIAMELFEQHGIEFEYTYTAVSSTFLDAMEKELEIGGRTITYKTLNVEDDPLTQGFIPEYYDVVVASNVLHNSQNIHESLQNLRTLIRHGGRLDIMEITSSSRIIPFLFGFSRGFPGFSDIELTSKHTILNHKWWIDILKENGFKISATFPSANYNYSFISSIKTNFDNILCRSIPEANHQMLNTWLVFCKENCNIADFLVEKLNSLRGRNVIKIFEKHSTNISAEVTIRKDVVKDFENVLNQFDSKIEGIVYSWCLNEQETVSQEDILEPYLNLAKSMTCLKQKQPRLVTLFSGVAPIPDNILNGFLSSTLWGFAKSWRNEITQINCKCVDIGSPTAAINNKARFMQVFYEIWSSNGKEEPQVAYSGLTKYVPKFQSHRPNLTKLRLPRGTNKFELQLPDSKTFSDLEYIPSKCVDLKETEIEIQVKAAGLNFKDVFAVLKPTDLFKTKHGIGSDFAGIVTQTGPRASKWNIGDAVFGVNFSQEDAMKSHVVIGEDAVIRIPDDMSFPEAATLSLAFLTAYYSLVKVAKITAKDTVLIHTASGGVGLASIQVCQHHGAKIICTAGSTRKKNYLKSLGIENVFHSRNTKYEEKILKVTNGKGVDIVLNTLTSDGFKEATLNVCAEGARFVEISKLQLWTPEDVKKLRLDVQYSIVDIEKLQLDKETWQGLITEFDDIIHNKRFVKPLPIASFNALNIREALQYLAKAQHIGKVICLMPENKNELNESNIFNDKGTYLITGGAGGIGFEVCKWMVQRGAKFITLAGRNSPNELKQNEILELNKKFNSKIVFVKLDVGNYAECDEFINLKLSAMKFPPLKGIMHCAGILQDDLFQNQSWQQFSNPLTAKVNGTLNLHELTKPMRLDHFVMFSSISSLIGIPGQTSYAAGNNFQDLFAHYRHHLGLPATSINWGQWGEVGLAVEMDTPGVKPMSNLQGLAALEYALESQQIQFSAINIHSFPMLNKIMPTISSYLDKRIWRAASGLQQDTIGISTELFWEKYDALDSVEKKVEFVKVQICCILKNTLKLDNSDTIPVEQDFKELGVDSLMFVEIKNAMQGVLGDRVTINPSVLRDCNNVKLLTEMLVKIIEGNEIHNEIPTIEQINSLIQEDSTLPESIQASEAQTVCKVTNISSVLLTGASGTLGPYILKELVKLSQIKEITCLMRPHSSLSPFERLKSILAKRGLSDEINPKKIICVEGDVHLSYLGMEKSQWASLCEKVDAVFHFAAKVSFLDHYQKKSQGMNEIRAVNIQGTKNVLEFCSSGSKLKHIFHAGALMSVVKTDKEGTLSEEWPDVEDFNGITTYAYPITKFVGDVLIKEAVTKRGIPGKLIRFPGVTGDKKGRFVLDQNFLMLRFLYILKTQMMPSTPVPIMTLPVDLCAQAGVKTFFDEKCEDGIYNVFHDKPQLEQEFVSVAERLGINVDIVDFDIFADKVRDSSDDSPFALFKDIYRNQVAEDLDAVSNSVPCIKQWFVSEGTGNENLFRCRKILKCIPDFYDTIEKQTESLYRDFQYAREQGWLMKYGIE